MMLQLLLAKHLTGSHHDTCNVRILTWHTISNWYFAILKVCQLGKAAYKSTNRAVAMRKQFHAWDSKAMPMTACVVISRKLHRAYVLLEWGINCRCRGGPGSWHLWFWVAWITIEAVAAFCVLPLRLFYWVVRGDDSNTCECTPGLQVFDHLIGKLAAVVAQYGYLSMTMSVMM